MKQKKILYLLTILSIGVLASCNNNSQTTEENSEEHDTSGFYTNSENTEKKVKKIFYTVPSPIELSNLLKKSGVSFDKNVMNPLTNFDKYLTYQKLALNLGTYGSDVSYARIMDQIQTSLDYIVVIKKISDRLGIPEEETKEIFERLEANINNRDSVLQLIAQSYGNADSYFKDNDQGNVAAMIILGGWVEGMYIALNIAETAHDKELIFRRIAEQKMSINNLVELLKSYPNDTLLSRYAGDLEELKVVFDNINIVYKKKNVETDTSLKMTVISGESTVAVNDDQLNKIKEMVSKIRNNIIN
jgi:hypothetical protein